MSLVYRKEFHRLYSLVLLVTFALVISLLFLQGGQPTRAAPDNQNVAHQTSFKRYADTNGDGTGTINIIGDYSSVTTTFFIQPPVTRTYVVAKTKIIIEDTSDFPTGGYGSIISPGLTSGILFEVVDNNGVVSDQLGGVPITTNAHWGRACDISFADLREQQGNY